MLQLWEKVAPICESLPFASLFSPSALAGLREDLKKADLPISATAYFNLVLVLSFAASFYFTIVAALFLPEPLTLFALFFLFFALAFFFGKNYPKGKARQRAEELEADLPMVLRSISLQLSINLPFEKCLEAIAQANYRISPEFSRAMSEIRHGASLPTALTSLSDRIDSVAFKRSLNQLIIAYEQGTKGEALKKIAEELTLVQAARSRQFSAKMSFLGLVFIAVSCLLPAFFAIILLVGSAFLSLSFTPLHIWFAFLLLFPFFDVILILYVQSQTPPSLSLHRASLEKEMELITTLLREKGIRYSLQQLLLISFGAGLLATGILVALGFIFPAFFYLAIFAFLSPLFVYFYLLYLSERRTLDMEQNLPDALFEAAALQKGTSLEKIIKKIASSRYGPLSHEFTTAYRQIEAGTSVPKALQAMAQRSSSFLLERAVNLILQGYKTGADISYALRETAEDIFALFALIRERSSNLTLQKYTILGGALIVPLILGTVLHTISTFDFSLGAQLFSANADYKQLFETTKLAAQVYLFIYVLLASILVSLQEGEVRKFIPYFLIIAPVALLLFHFTSQLDLAAFV